jgi:hypothetical protein
MSSDPVYRSVGLRTPILADKNSSDQHVGWRVKIVQAREVMLTDSKYWVVRDYPVPFVTTIVHKKCILQI